MNREEIMDTVMRTRGFEDKYTIAFCTLCEDTTVADDIIIKAFVNVMKYL